MKIDDASIERLIRAVRDLQVVDTMPVVDNGLGLIRVQMTQASWDELGAALAELPSEEIPIAPPVDPLAEIGGFRHCPACGGRLLNPTTPAEDPLHEQFDIDAPKCLACDKRWIDCPCGRRRVDAVTYDDEVKPSLEGRTECSYCRALDGGHTMACQVISHELGVQRSQVPAGSQGR